MPTPLDRKYDISDANMLSDANNKRAYFIEDQVDFANFDLDFASPYEANWLTTIEAAETFVDDETVLDQITGKTQTLNTIMGDCRDYYQGAKHFVEKAFPNNPAVQKEFGFNDYDEARKTQPKMVLFMYKFHKVAQQYNVELIAKNYSQIMIDGIKTLADNLKAANVDQDTFIGNRGVKTSTRSTLHNNVWDITTLICKTGKRLYRDDYGKYHRYMLPGSEEPEAELALKGFVRDSITNLVLEDATVSIVELAINTQTDSLGKYAFGILPAGTYTLEITKAGYTSQTLPGIIITDGITTTQDIQLVAGAGVSTGTVSGTVIHSALPAIGATVSVNGFPLLTTTTDPSGSYTLSNVPAGAQSITASLGPLSPIAPQTLPTSVPAGGMVNLNFNFA